MAGQVRVIPRYQAANTIADLSPEARKLGRGSMAEFLLSPQVQDAATDVGKEIANDLRDSIAQHFDATNTLGESVESHAGEPMVIKGNPRATAQVSYDGGVYPGARQEDSTKAAVVEFGNSVNRDYHLLREAGQPYHTEKGPA